MYGLIGQIKAQPGQREALVAILLENAEGMPGNLSYVVALDAKDADAIWVTEVWQDEAHHKGSLQLPAVQDAISRAKPLIAGFGLYQPTQPVGGIGHRAGR